jgi:hypothetical protein
MSRLTCTDECGNKHKYYYIKVCLGLAVGGGVNAGPVFGVTGANCRGERYREWFMEDALAAGPLSIGGEFGANSDGPLGFLPGSFSGVNEGSVGIGAGIEIKHSMCYYIQL